MNQGIRSEKMSLGRPWTYAVSLAKGTLDKGRNWENLLKW